MSYPFWMEFRDNKGYQSRVHFYIYGFATFGGDVVAAGLIPLVDTMSNANLQSTGGAHVVDTTPPAWGSSAVYSSVADKARFVFVTVSGMLWRFDLPAPSAGIFLPDGETLDPANADVVALANELTIGHYTSRSGDNLVDFIGGHRHRVRAQRRLGSYIYDPTLTVRG